jgi:hypothetical protein
MHKNDGGCHCSTQQVSACTTAPPPAQQVSVANDVLDFKWTMAPAQLSAADQLHYGVVLARSVGIDSEVLDRALGIAQVGRALGQALGWDAAVGRQLGRGPCVQVQHPPTQGLQRLWQQRRSSLGWAWRSGWQRRGLLATSFVGGAAADQQPVLSSRCLSCQLSSAPSPAAPSPALRLQGGQTLAALTRLPGDNQTCPIHSSSRKQSVVLLLRSAVAGSNRLQQATPATCAAGAAARGQGPLRGARR